MGDQLVLDNIYVYLYSVRSSALSRKGSKMRDAVKRVFYLETGVTGPWSTGEIDLTVVSEPKANIVSSRCQNGFHAPVFDFDFEVARRGQQIIFLGAKLVALHYRNLAIALHRMDIITTRERDRILRSTPDTLSGIEKATVRFRKIVPFKLRPSKTAGHFHLLMDILLSWHQYTELLEVFCSTGIIEKRFLNLCGRHKMGMLYLVGRKDGVRDYSQVEAGWHAYR